MSFALQEANSAGTERLLARTDELTGLANRRNFLAQLAAVLKSGYIFLLDLDGFKRINDTLGHESGDQLLKTGIWQIFAGNSKRLSSSTFRW
jgi:diguanylate cyclase